MTFTPYGALAQLVERHDGIVEASGSNPLRSKSFKATVSKMGIAHCKTGFNPTSPYYSSLSQTTLLYSLLEYIEMEAWT